MPAEVTSWHPGPWELIAMILDHADYTSGACQINECVGAVLPIDLIQMAKAELRLRNERKAKRLDQEGA